MRVNVEASALAEGRFNNLAEDVFEGSRSYAIGTLVIFWFDSQEREFVSGTKKEVMKFLPGTNEVYKAKIFEALLKYDYIKKIGRDKYEISGNERHVEKLQHLKEVRSAAAKKGNEVRWGNKESQNIANESQAVASFPRNSMQFNSVQSNSIQDNAGNMEPADFGLPHLAELWNKHSSPEFPKVRGCSKERKKKAVARWSEHPHEDYWIKVIGAINESEFCRGKNKSGWVANFDFLIKPDTQFKALEGAYSKKIEKTGADIWLEQKLREEAAL